MINAQNTKFVALLHPAAISDNATPTTVAIDTAGWGYCQIYVYFGAMDIAMATMKVQESDTLTDANTLSSGADITGLVTGTSTNIAGSTSALPSATADNTAFLYEFPTAGRKRYIDLAAVTGDGSAGTYLTAFAILSNPKNVVTTAADRGLADILRLPS